MPLNLKISFARRSKKRKKMPEIIKEISSDKRREIVSKTILDTVRLLTVGAFVSDFFIKFTISQKLSFTIVLIVLFVVGWLMYIPQGGK